jgi:predicted Rossmann fold flavoprotein
VEDSCDILVIGAGAAGLFSATWAGRTAARNASAGSILAVDGARTLGAKILVAGGGRCNVTHWRVDEHDYAGSTPAGIRKVLRRFGVDDTVRFFEERGVTLRREETGKLFPESNRARSVLDALVAAAVEAKVAIRHPARVTGIDRADGGFHVATSVGPIRARKVVLATGGRSLPKSGSDGLGHDLARGLGHSITEPVVPALVPLVLAEGHWIRSLSGLTLPTSLSLAHPSGRRLLTVTGSTLCTHFGLSGPCVLDISRHWLVARETIGTDVRLSVAWLPETDEESADAMLLADGGRSALATLRRRLPERLARALCEAAGAAVSGDLTREARRRLAGLVAATPLPVVGDRGYAVAEATAGGVPLSEVRPDSMESRICPGLHLAGEILDVDGRIGGFNFQWAWASGYVAGVAAAGLGSATTTARSPRRS